MKFELSNWRLNKNWLRLDKYFWVRYFATMASKYLNDYVPNFAFSRYNCFSRLKIFHKISYPYLSFNYWFVSDLSFKIPPVSNVIPDFIPETDPWLYNLFLQLGYNPLPRLFQILSQKFLYISELHIPVWSVS